MYDIRLAVPTDVEIIAQHRRSMFFDMGVRNATQLSDMERSFRPWLQRKMEAEEYLGWFALAQDGSVAAGAGLWLMDWPPGLYTSESRRGNILNVYTHPAHRRHGLARRLVQVILDWCSTNGIQVVILHASDEGRPLYRALGFQPTNEMRLLPVDPAPRL
jgi:GNAT superfamily N-acetyltransferase